MANEIRAEQIPALTTPGKPGSALSLFIERHPVLVFTLPAAADMKRIMAETEKK